MKNETKGRGGKKQKAHVCQYPSALDAQSHSMGVINEDINDKCEVQSIAGSKAPIAKNARRTKVSIFIKRRPGCNRVHKYASFLFIICPSFVIVYWTCVRCGKVMLHEVKNRKKDRSSPHTCLDGNVYTSATNNVSPALNEAE